MNKTVLLVLSAITAGTLGAGGVLIGVVASGYALNKTSWIVAGISFAVTASKDIRSQLSLPPVSNGNTQFIPKPPDVTPKTTA